MNLPTEESKDVTAVVQSGEERVVVAEKSAEDDGDVEVGVTIGEEYEDRPLVSSDEEDDGVVVIASRSGLRKTPMKGRGFASRTPMLTSKEPGSTVKEIVDYGLATSEEELRKLRFNRHFTAFDVDINGLDEQPWRNKNVDVSDYFNFGFTERTWMIYCEKQLRLRAEKGLAPRDPSAAGSKPFGPMALNASITSDMVQSSLRGVPSAAEGADTGEHDPASSRPAAQETPAPAVEVPQPPLPVPPSAANYAAPPPPHAPMPGAPPFPFPPGMMMMMPGMNPGFPGFVPPAGHLPPMPPPPQGGVVPPPPPPQPSAGSSKRPRDDHDDYRGGRESDRRRDDDRDMDRGDRDDRGSRKKSRRSRSRSDSRRRSSSRDRGRRR